MNESTGAAAEMPRYKSHKIVHALKISGIVGTPDGGAQLTWAEDGYRALQVGPSYVLKHSPKAGGYFVIYDDGYQSWSPAEAFESGYARVDDKVDSASDERTVNNVMRHEYRVLDENEKILMKDIKDAGSRFHSLIEETTRTFLDPRCAAVAKTKIEEAVMWAIKGLTS